MPIALTNSKIVHRIFDATTPGQLVYKVSQVLYSVGWTLVPVTDGYKLTCASPQGIQIAFYARDLGHAFFNPYATFNFETMDGTIAGMDHELSVNSTINTTYQVVAGKCWFAISHPGISTITDGGSLCGGIPFFPDGVLCGSEVPSGPAPSQSFWCMGEGAGDVGPRNALILNHDMSQSEALWGTDYCAPGNLTGCVRIPAMGYASQIFSGLDLPSPMLYRSGAYLTYEPMLVWGIDNTVSPIIRAQTYDSMIFSIQRPVDYITVEEDFTYINYTGDWLLGGLNFIKGRTVTTGAGGNRVYIKR